MGHNLTYKELCYYNDWHKMIIEEEKKQIKKQ